MNGEVCAKCSHPQKQQPGDSIIEPQTLFTVSVSPGYGALDLPYTFVFIVPAPPVVLVQKERIHLKNETVTKEVVYPRCRSSPSMLG